MRADVGKSELTTVNCAMLLYWWGYAWSWWGGWWFWWSWYDYGNDDDGIGGDCDNKEYHGGENDGWWCSHIVL